MNGRSSLPVAVDRPLSPFESYFAVTSATIWLTGEVSGPLDLGTLRRAWGLLCRAHSVLTAHLAPTRDDRSVVGLRGLRIVVPAVPAAAPIGRADDRVRTLGVDDPVAMLTVTDGDPALVAFAVHHSIADGRLAHYWYRELWSYYTDLVAGRAPAIRPRPVPDSPETLLAAHGIVRTALPPGRLERATPTAVASGRSVLPARWQQIRLSAQETTGVLADAKRRGLTVHSLVAGAIAVVTRRFLPLGDDRAAEINVVSPVDIRTRLEPPVPVWAGTNILGMANAVVAVRPCSDPVVIGSGVTGQLAEDLAAGVIHQSFLHMADTVDRPRPLVPRTIATNLGVVAPIPTPEGTAVVALRHSLRFDWAPVVAMMAASGYRDHPLLRTSVHMIHTYRGQLVIDFTAALPGGPAEQYGDELAKVLRGTSGPA
ncbi:hypothetical protein ACFXK0_08400 [Nocardia sp. NPDC059177]|uniref:phthiocerol/phthiodiolone dimycocerosyl transferase family protein n=1 Tax=Nocardia sp. NPDC059177 TaxID=3346759 RepID=UPI00368A5EDD